MNEKENSQNSRPTFLQIQYLIELEKSGNTRGCMIKIANNCGVSHVAVSKFFKQCRDNGDLTKNNRFTEKGLKNLKMYKRLLQDVEEYLVRIGSKKHEIPDLTRQLMDNVDYNLLLRIVRNDQIIRRNKDTLNIKDRGERAYESILRRGTYQVGIALYRVGEHNQILGYSMANQAFERPGLLTINKRGIWLELTPRIIEAQSRVDGKVKQGKLESLKYYMDGKLTVARWKEGRVKIPLEACNVQKNSRGNIKASVSVLVTCTIGQQDMPESSAYLIFWM